MFVWLLGAFPRITGIGFGFSGGIFINSLLFQALIADYPAGELLHFAFRLFETAFDLIFVHTALPVLTIHDGLGHRTQLSTLTSMRIDAKPPTLCTVAHIVIRRGPASTPLPVETCANTNTCHAHPGLSLCLATLTVGTLCIASQHVVCATVLTRLRGFRYSIINTSIRWRNRRSAGFPGSARPRSRRVKRMLTFVRAILLRRFQ
jgi:hypothetical protein